MVKKQIFVIMFVLFINTILAFGDSFISAGFDSTYTPGAKLKNGHITKVDVGLFNGCDSCNQFIDINAYVTGIHSSAKDKNSFGPGIKFCFNKRIAFRMSPFIGAGILFLHKGGNIDGLAQSSMYGTIDAGVEYKSFFICVNHISSPFHKSDDGDYGVNTITLGKKF